jgi:inositol oxygenase
MTSNATVEIQTLKSAEKAAYRNYAAPQVSEAQQRVREFYRLNHTHQTHDFVKAKKADFLSFTRQKMNLWDALDYLNTLVDDSDPDTALPQIDHLVQTAEAMRKDGQPDWMVLTGFIHDLGKVLCLFGEPQWAVVGDTFPTGCAYSSKIVYSEFFAHNPDQVHMSWGHDEYLYHLLRQHLPMEALYMIRYHSFYSWHKEGDYDHLCNDQDRAMLPWVQRFNPYDLYSKNPNRPVLRDVKPYYEDLMAKYLPADIQF